MAQGLGRAVSAFSLFLRQQLDEFIMTGKCFLYVDYVGTAATNSEKMIANLTEKFKCICEGGLKLSPNRCEYGQPKVSFLVVVPQLILHLQ